MLWLTARTECKCRVDSELLESQGYQVSIEGVVVNEKCRIGECGKGMTCFDYLTVKLAISARLEGHFQPRFRENQNIQDAFEVPSRHSIETKRLLANPHTSAG